MQTFITAPVPFAQSARMLDDRRLNKQILEGWQIFMNLCELDPDGNYREPKGWRNHPAVKMWRGHEWALYAYVLAMIIEWERRGRSTVVKQKLAQSYLAAKKAGKLTNREVPDWIADGEWFEQITSSHRKALLCKQYEWYAQFSWPEDTGSAPETYEYVWGVK